MSDFNRRIIDEFRANDGKVGGPFEGAPMVILHTRGAKSGEPREHPLVYFDHDGRRFVIASAAGAERSPAWYHNLVANPDVELEVGGETYAATARPLGEPERTELFDEFATQRPNFRDYQDKTARTIPVVELTPA